jgi:hypothetical protein
MFEALLFEFLWSLDAGAWSFISMRRAAVPLSVFRLCLLRSTLSICGQLFFRAEGIEMETAPQL